MLCLLLIAQIGSASLHCGASTGENGPGLSNPKQTSTVSLQTSSWATAQAAYNAIVLVLEPVTKDALHQVAMSQG